MFRFQFDSAFAPDSLGIYSVYYTRSPLPTPHFDILDPCLIEALALKYEGEAIFALMHTFQEYFPSPLATSRLEDARSSLGYIQQLGSRIIPAHCPPGFSSELVRIGQLLAARCTIGLNSEPYPIRERVAITLREWSRVLWEAQHQSGMFVCINASVSALSLLPKGLDYWSCADEMIESLMARSMYHLYAKQFAECICDVRIAYAHVTDLVLRDSRYEEEIFSWDESCHKHGPLWPLCRFQNFLVDVCPIAMDEISDQIVGHFIERGVPCSYTAVFIIVGLLRLALKSRAFRRQDQVVRCLDKIRHLIALMPTAAVMVFDDDDSASAMLFSLVGDLCTTMPVASVSQMVDKTMAFTRLGMSRRRSTQQSSALHWVGPPRDRTTLQMPIPWAKHGALHNISAVFSRMTEGVLDPPEPIPGISCILANRAANAGPEEELLLRREVVKMWRHAWKSRADTESLGEARASSLAMSLEPLIRALQRGEGDHAEEIAACQEEVQQLRDCFSEID